MKKFLFLLLIFVAWGIFPNSTFAQMNSYANIVNPVRGTDFWEMEKQKPEDAVIGQIEVLKEKNARATWLIRFDALKNEAVMNALTQTSPLDEKGLFLEVTPTFTSNAGVKYRESRIWHFAESVLLTGYERDERIKLIDTSFEEFKSKFGYYPKSVGAWWIDSFSLSYMESKYQITGALIVADQYSTDNYQIWGQYWSTPYYPRKDNGLYPAQNATQKIPVVIYQWAARDPVNGYGKGVEESTYSVQANDYIDYHELDINYFAKLVDIYTNQKQNLFGEIVVGLENSYDWGKYKEEYGKQVQVLIDRQKSGQLQVVTMREFSEWYKNRFPDISPAHSIIADDPLGSERKVLWFMNQYYRSGWFYNNQGSLFRDVRQYVEGDREPCLENSCKEVNFATFKTRSLDEVTFQDTFVINPGKLSNVSYKKFGEELQLTYETDAGIKKLVSFMPRDIKIDERVYSIDGLILQAKEQQLENEKKIDLQDVENVAFYFTLGSLAYQLVVFILFLIVGFFIPGILFIRSITFSSLLEKKFIALSIGISIFTLLSFIIGMIGTYLILIPYFLISFGLFIKYKMYKEWVFNFSIRPYSVALTILIVLGVIFQSLAVVRSGWVYEFGMGFWGPTGHDHVWHQALSNQLEKGIPPENPIFAGESLSNYHYFFNVLISSTRILTNIDSLHLLYRFYPVLLSLLLGIGFYVLSKRLFKNNLISFLTVYFVYFGSSFGWIVDYFRSGTFGGESNFWINQPVSFNLNPPFAVSMILFLAVLLLFDSLLKSWNIKKVILFVVLAGCLIEFKVYAGLIVIAGLLVISLQQLLFFKEIMLFKLFIPTTLFSALLFIPQNLQSSNLIVFQPFWFIHSMVDSPDRLGIHKLSEARMAYQQRGETFKFLGTEIIALVIYILGNLGTRMIALFLLPTLLLKQVRNNLLLSFILWIIIISFSVPILFIQKGTPWNTIQFSYYGIYFITIFAAFGLWKLYSVLPRIVGVGVLLFILGITPISSYATFEGGFGEVPPARLTFGEMEALATLSKEDEGVVLTYPFVKQMRERFEPAYPLFAYETSSYVSAFSKKPTFIEDEIQMEIMQIDYKKRLSLATEFFRGRDATWSTEFLQKNSIRYIYLPRVFGISLSEDQLPIVKIFENSQVTVFKVK